MKNLTDRIFPRNSLRRRILKRILVRLGVRSNLVVGYYNTWFYQKYEQPLLGEQVNLTSNAPLISIIVPAFNPPKLFLDELVYSIISQAYPKWELILVNSSSEPASKRAINELVDKDSRITVVDKENKGISNNTNIGIKSSKGEYVAFVDHDDVLEPFALYEIATAILSNGAELIYTDEDKITDAGEIYFDPHFKPDWSPDLLTHVNYINHLTVVKKSILDEVGLLDSNKDGAQDYDLILRITDTNPKIVHIPKVLYHWRAARNSTARDFSQKQNVTQAGRSALSEHFNRLGLEIEVKPKDDRPGFYELKFDNFKHITAIVAPFATDALLRLFVELLLKSTDTKETSVQLIVPEGAQPRHDFKNITVELIKTGDDFINQALKRAKYDQLIVINEVALPQDRDWMLNLTSVLKLKHIRAVSPVIVRNKSIIEDCGLVITANGHTHALFRNMSAFNNQTFFGNTDWTRNVDALTGGIIAVHKEALNAFLKPRNYVNFQKSLLEFSMMPKDTGKYNVIYPQVVFDNYSIRLMPKSAPNKTFFNNNLLHTGSDYEIYTPEASAINILNRLPEMDQAND